MSKLSRFIRKPVLGPLGPRTQTNRDAQLQKQARVRYYLSITEKGALLAILRLMCYIICANCISKLCHDLAQILCIVYDKRKYKFPDLETFTCKYI